MQREEGMEGRATDGGGAPWEREGGSMGLLGGEE